MRSIAVGSFSLSCCSFIFSLLALVDSIPEMFESKVLKLPTSPEVAGDEVVLFGELVVVDGKQPLS